MFLKKNIDKISKDMQIAGLKEILKNLKNVEEFTRYEIEPILKTLNNILSCYNCMPNKCLKKRIQYLLSGIYNVSEIKINVQSLIAELETMLSSNTEDNKETTEKVSPI